MNPQPCQFAVIGHPIAHSRSPAIHESFAHQTGIALCYERIDAEPEAFEDTVRDFFARGGRGLNVTVPFKERAFMMAQAHLSIRAQRAAAVNTLWQENGAIHGCNTDGIGLQTDLKRLGMLQHVRRILMLGAGGAARGVLGPLLESGCEVLHIANRTASKAQTLVDEWLLEQPQDRPRLSAGGLQDASLAQPWDLIINATSSSLSGQSLELPPTAIHASTAVYDMMYGAQPTAFLQSAQALGAQRCADGLGMLVGQAAESFRIWHGVQPDIQATLQQLRAQLK